MGLLNIRSVKEKAASWKFMSWQILSSFLTLCMLRKRKPAGEIWSAELMIATSGSETWNGRVFTPINRGVWTNAFSSSFSGPVLCSVTVTSRSPQVILDARSQICHIFE